MRNKPLSEVEQAVEMFVTVECGITYDVAYAGEQTRDDNWKCDCWRFDIKGHSFEYFTGTGHREQPTELTKRTAAFEFQGLTEKDKAGRTMYGRRYLQRVEELRKPQTPPIAGLLHSLILDSAAAEQTFNSWCSDFGYDTDSRKALATYEACQKAFDKLRKVFNSEQIKRMREMLEDY